MYDIAIIGAGPAGMTAGIYAKRAGYSVVVFEMGAPGGQAAITDFVENFPGFPGGISGPELMMKFYEHATGFGVDIKFEQVTKVEVADTTKKVITQDGANLYEAKVVIFAMGAHPSELGAPNEQKFRGRGVSYCATCDGFFFKDKKVCVVGGGDAAVEEAMYLTKMAESVTLFHRRDSLRANRHSQELAFKNEKITFVWDTVIESFEGNEKLEIVKTKNLKTGEEKEWNFDGCFVFTGYTPNADIVPSEVEQNERGYIITNHHLATNVPGVYAVGDVREKSVRQIGTAVGDSSMVMHDVERYMREELGQ